ncbi:hypothetical protein GY45DRAFT_132588 [Cubamyces sp. BRFM 1775]|nr:hypothetical protein GY45DRAFT_132588 [Cubamyces sp. BRFM 1775]
MLPASDMNLHSPALLDLLSDTPRVTSPPAGATGTQPIPSQSQALPDSQWDIFEDF